MYEFPRVCLREYSSLVVPTVFELFDVKECHEHGSRIGVR